MLEAPYSLFKPGFSKCSSIMLMKRKICREIYVKTLNPSSFPLQLKVFLLNGILK